jgi:heat shock protein HslJ
MVPPQGSTGEWHYVTAVQGRPLTVTIFERRCVDEMSGMPHPTSVEVTFRNEQYGGCGGDPVTLLRGAAWMVEAMDGVRAPPRTMLSFGADGRMTGSGPCNQFDAVYSLTGEGLAVSRPATTRKACSLPRLDIEQRLLETLEHAHHFELTGDGALVVHASDGRTLAARRVAR